MLHTFCTNAVYLNLFLKEFHVPDVQLCYCKIAVLVKLLLNKATCYCSFVNLSPIFTILRIPMNNDIVDISHDFGCVGNHVGVILCVTR